MTGQEYSRRRFLRASGTGLLAVGAAGLASTGLAGCTPTGTAATGVVLPSTGPLPAPFTAELRHPNRLRFDRTGQGALVQRSAEVEILPGRRTTVWGYNGTFPGPTLDLASGRPVRLTVHNELPVPTSTHLHGGATPSDSDGLPMDLVMPPGFDPAWLDIAMANGHSSHGKQAGNDQDPNQGGGHGQHGGHSSAPSSGSSRGSGNGHGGHGSMPWTLHDRRRDHHYPLAQPAALLWYHDHRMDFSAPQVWRGLAGMAVVRDEHEASLGLPDGDRELLLMFTDRSFGPDAELLYPAKDPELRTQPGATGSYGDGVLGDVMLVNGVPFPVAHLRRTSYRLRLVNGCNARPLRLSLRPGTGPVLPLQQIGTDQGLLAAPRERTTVELHPGERVDLVVDLSGLPDGETLVLANDARPHLPELMKIVLGGTGPAPAPLPGRLAEVELLDPADAVTERRFDFRMQSGGAWGINGQLYDPLASIADPVHGTVEKWVFSSDFVHPVHVHTGHFQVIGVNGRGVDEADRGWKDTVPVSPYGVVEVLVRFPDLPGPSMIHCHNLEHEDMGMMAGITVR